MTSLLMFRLLVAVTSLDPEIPLVPLPIESCSEEVYNVRMADEAVEDNLRLKNEALKEEVKASKEDGAKMAVNTMIAGLIAGALIGGGIVLFSGGVAAVSAQ